MKAASFALLAAIKQSVDEVHAAHPGSVPVNRMHARMDRAREHFAHLLTDEQDGQLSTLAGGTPKPPPAADEGEG